ncbi:DUF6612 family protein [Mammaliicoccus sp. Dog046]|uniref:DUF6612 family protein n=1 Tax=Mammaliicoccus sp. Dog046 TaxID=3034233 RepID=UPI002B25929B|nr:DUF6612 family protein [Mammaliicoccus sp. Dog046]WQK86376.1 DUF6612 family protein [Mammaliicoccus sp. Dog046]
MKLRILGSIFLSSTLLLAACGNDEKSSSDVVKDLQSDAKKVESYHTDNQVEIAPKGQEAQKVKIGMDVDKKQTAKLDMDQAGQKMQIYVQGKKMLAQTQGQWIDLSSEVKNMDIDSSLDQLNYEKYAKSLSAFKDAESKKVDNGYQLTYNIKDKKDFTKLANASGNKKQLQQFEKQIDKVSGKAVLNVNKKNQISSYKLNAKLSKGKQSANLKSNIKYTKLNKVDEIKIPDEAKKAKKIEDIQKGASNKAS